MIGNAKYNKYNIKKQLKPVIIGGTEHGKHLSGND